PDGAYISLGSFRQSSAKSVEVWALEADVDPTKLVSNTFQMEWPPRSGRMQEFPEVDRAGWFEPSEAARKILRGQKAILTALCERLGIGANAQRLRGIVGGSVPSGESLPYHASGAWG